MFQKYHMTAVKYGDHNTHQIVAKVADFSDFSYLSVERQK